MASLQRQNGGFKPWFNEVARKDLSCCGGIGYVENYLVENRCRYKRDFLLLKSPAAGLVKSRYHKAKM